jgi:hypothetical protein
MDWSGDQRAEQDSLEGYPTNPYWSSPVRPDRREHVPEIAQSPLDQFTAFAGNIKTRPVITPYHSYSSAESANDWPNPTTASSYHSISSQDNAYSHSRTASDSSLLETHPHFPVYTRNGNKSRFNTSFAQLRWRSNSSWMMYVCFIVGIAGATSHHFFYTSLRGKEAKDQILMLRYGTALAYITKASFAASVGLAYSQQIWATFRRKSLSVGAIDSLFTAHQDVSSLANMEIFRQAKLAVFLAVLVWLMPLAVVLTAATLAVEPTLVVNQTVCSSVRTLNFTPEATNNWRYPHRLRAGLPELSLSSWNVTSSDLDDPNLFDYYTAPSAPAQQVTTMSAYLKRVLYREEISVESCGAGWNCTYNISFIGPGYKCRGK